jgi:hypothetical protein
MMDWKAPPTDKTTISFVVYCTEATGHKMFVTGSVKELGEWKVLQHSSVRVTFWAERGLGQ